jgi:hypothetical protein
MQIGDLSIQFMQAKFQEVLHMAARTLTPVSQVQDLLDVLKP